MLAAILTGCTQEYQSAGPTVRKAAIEGDVFIMPDDQPLRVRITDAVGPPRAAVLALHGINDYGHAFQEAAARWANEGIVTYAYDQRGFGANARPGIWPGAETLVSDLGHAASLVRARHPDLPLYLVGESMGSAVIMASLGGDSPPAVDGAVLGAPAVWARPTMSGSYQRVLSGMRSMMPGLVLRGSGLGRQATDNIDVLIAMGRDPLVIKGARVDAIAGLVDLMDAAYHAAPNIRTPLLVLFGKRDEIVPRRAVALTVARMTNNPVIAVYEKGWHMLYRDLNSPILQNDVRHWIMKGGRDLPSGADDQRGYLLDETASAAGKPS